MTRPQDKAPKAPPPNAKKSEHRKHVEEFLAIEDFKDPKKANGPSYVDQTDVPREP